MKFVSKTHTIEAFQFTGDMTFKPPQWFIDDYQAGKASFTLNEKYGTYITIYDENRVTKAKKGDWICRAANSIFRLTDDEMSNLYEPKA